MRKLVLIAMMGAFWPLAGLRAQPVLIPLQPQQQQPSPNGDQAVVSAPPQAPPQAGPSLPSTTDVAGASPVINPQEETASQPGR